MLSFFNPIEGNTHFCKCVACIFYMEPDATRIGGRLIKLFKVRRYEGGNEQQHTPATSQFRVWYKVYDEEERLKLMHPFIWVCPLIHWDSWECIFNLLWFSMMKLHTVHTGASWIGNFDSDRIKPLLPFQISTFPNRLDENQNDTRIEIPTIMYLLFVGKNMAYFCYHKLVLSLIA